jgi:hypothetical protein
MKKKITSYVVFDKKERWMGGYSTSLADPPLSHSTPAIEMAITNAEQSNGKVYEVYNSGDMKQIYPKEK